MKKIPLILFISILISLGSYIILEILDRTMISRAYIDFELPLPEEVAKSYGVSLYPVVESVVLTGFFSDWDPMDKNYLMLPENPDPKNHKWGLEVILPPGEHQYKFAIYIEGRPEPLWSHDMDSYKQVFNGMNSVNSLVKIKSYKNISTILLNITFILLILTVPYLFYLFSFGSGIKQFLLLISLLVFISNILFSVFYIFYSRINYTFTSKSIISILQNDIGQESYITGESERIYKSFNFFLWYKLDKMGIQNLEERFKSVSFLYFDHNFNYVVSDLRAFSNRAIEEPSSEKIFSKQINRLKQSDVDIMNYTLPGYEHLYNRIHLGAKNSYIYPMIIDNKIEGYIGICFTENPVQLFNFYMKFNIGSVLVFLAIIFIFTLLRKAPGESDDHLIKLFADKYSITTRERDIISYLLEGCSNREIAESLNISKRTVDNHVYNTLHKAGAKNRVELVHIVKNSL